MNATVGQMKWLGEVDAKVTNFVGMREVDTTVSQSMLWREGNARLNYFDGLEEVEV